MTKWVVGAALALLALPLGACGKTDEATAGAPAGAAAPVTPPLPDPTPAPPPEIAATTPEDPADPYAAELTRIEKELLPSITEKARNLRASERGDGVEYDKTRSEAMAALAGARTFLNDILEKDPRHRRANKLWTKLQELYTSLKRL